MTADNDTDDFFERHSISEIEQLLAKTRTDIEKKKEDLRVMVGERYRDLIEAADTISSMQNSAVAISLNIHTMEGLCESLQQRGLIGFKTRLTHGEPETTRLIGSEQLYSFATQVKLLVDVPEMLWSLTEKRNFLNATLLLLLSQQAHTAMQLSPHSNDILPQFPVVSYQWSTIQQFKSTIIKGCITIVKKEIDNYEPVLDALVSMMLIEGFGMEEALDKLLVLRSSILESILIPRPPSLAKDQLIEFVMLYMSSIYMVTKIFIASEGEGGVPSLLEQKIRSITQSDSSNTQTASPPINLLQESPIALEFLPKSIVDFRPKLHSPLQIGLEKICVKKKLSNWLLSLIDKSKCSIEELLNCTTTVKSLSLIRNDILSTLSKHRFQLKNEFELQEMHKAGESDPWRSIIQPKVLERAKYLVRKELQDICHDLIRVIKELIEDIIKTPKVCSEEGDITSFVWGESSSDLPDKVAWPTASMRQSTSALEAVSGGRGLFFKTRGYTKRIQNISKHLNNSMECVLADILHYSSAELQTKTDFSSVEAADEDQNGTAALQQLADEDFETILTCMEEETLTAFKRCAADLEQLGMEYSQLNENAASTNLWEENKASKPSQGATILIVVSRLCNAFGLVCNQLKIASMASFLLNPDSARRLNLGVHTDSSSWLELKKILFESSNRLMVHFLSHLCYRLKIGLKHELSSVLRSGNVEDTFIIFPTWESFTIAEEDESGNPVKSNICIPSHPSPILTQALMKLCSSINYVSIHTVTRSSHVELNKCLCSNLVSIYEDLNDTFNLLNQTTALQILFDIKFIQMALVSRDWKDINSKLSEILRKVESRVDPFDLDVFLPHINSRLKTSTQRLQVLLGILIPKDKQIIARPSSVPSGGNSILLVVPSVEIPRFSNVPLPISSSMNSYFLDSRLSLDNKALLPSLPLKNERDVSIGSQDSSSTSSGATSSLSALSASRSAVSLFSAMSSSWFGTGTSS